VDKKQLLTLSLIELDKAGSLCAQLYRSGDNSSKPLLLTTLESLQRVQTLLVALHTSELETCQDGLVSEDTSE
jgi:hypothetical protein